MDTEPPPPPPPPPHMMPNLMFALHPMTSTAIPSDLTRLPSSEEVKACWELCRLQNNIGFWVIYLPMIWSLLMAYHADPQTTFVVLAYEGIKYVPMCFGVKCLIMTVDDCLDYDIDVQVERTRMRPIPRGAITPLRAWQFFSIQVVVGIVLAFRLLEHRTLRISMLVWPIFIIYPTCKRWMSFAPVPLGMMFNIGVFMGWSELSREDFDWPVLAHLYIASILWTVTYETIYQHLDRPEDIKLGIRSMAILFGRQTIPLCAVAAVGFLSLFAYSGILNGQGWSFFASVMIAGTVVARRLANTNIDRNEECVAFFLGSTHVSLVLAVGLAVDAITSRVARGVPL